MSIKKSVLTLMVATSLFAAVPSVFAHEMDAPPSTPDATKLVLRGHAETKVQPETATIRFILMSGGTTSSEALTKNGNFSNEVSEAFAKIGVGSENFEVVDFRAEPVFDYKPHKPPKVTGYQVVNTIDVTMPVSQCNDAVRTLADAGVIYIDQIRFDKNENEMKRTALAKAVEDALAKAERLKVQLNKQNIIVKSIMENSVNIMYNNLTAAKESVPTSGNIPVFVKKIDASADVDVVVEIN